MKHISKVVILFLLCSCGIIAINENDYRFLTKIGFDEYVFKDSKLIYIGNRITKETLDSLVRIF